MMTRIIEMYIRVFNKHTRFVIILIWSCFRGSGNPWFP